MLNILPTVCTNRAHLIPDCEDAIVTSVYWQSASADYINSAEFL